MWYLFSGTMFARYFFYLITFSGVTYLATCEWVKRLRLPADVSYGVFLWGFPVQQSLVHCFPNMNVLSNQILSVILAIGFGAASWFLVEARAIEIGKRCARLVYGSTREVVVLEKRHEAGST